MMAGKTIETWIAVAIIAMLLNVTHGQFFTRSTPTPRDGEERVQGDPFRPPRQTPAPRLTIDCRAMGASIAEDAFRGNEEAAAGEQATSMVNADLDRAGRAFWVQTGCNVRRVNVPITRFFTLGNTRIRCTGTVQVGVCFGFCRSFFTINVNNNAVFKSCECCEPTRLRSVTQNVVLTCSRCLFYNYRFTSIQPQRCRCQSC